MLEFHTCFNENQRNSISNKNNSAPLLIDRKYKDSSKFSNLDCVSFTG